MKRIENGLWKEAMKNRENEQDIEQDTHWRWKSEHLSTELACSLLYSSPHHRKNDRRSQTQRLALTPGQQPSHSAIHIEFVTEIGF